MKHMSKLVLLFLLITTFSGCAYQHRKPSPEFAPVRPPIKIAPVTENGAIYQKVNSISLFESNRARRVGDILTVVFDEKHVAKKETKTEDNKSGSIGLSAPTVFGKTGDSLGALDVLNNSIASTNDFKSKGKSEQKNSLTGSISVSVVEVLPNGNLVIRGEKLLTLNQGDEYVQLSGIIRSLDLGADNMVISSKIANAKIVYSGQGMTHDSNQGGWGTRFFLSDKWPF
ncbi:MAG: flagellar basal body L-ring protein FlgH [Pseudomonadota bacterium]